MLSHGESLAAGVGFSSLSPTGGEPLYFSSGARREVENRARKKKKSQSRAEESPLRTRD